MSLVAAYSESDSESEIESGNEEKVESTHQTKRDSPLNEELNDDDNNDDFEIEDEDAWQKTTTNQNTSSMKIFSNLPAPTQTSISMNQEEADDEFLKKKVTKEDKLFKKEQALLEQEQQERKGKNTNSNFLAKFTTKSDGRKKNKKQKIKISIPTLEEIGADSDSDGEEKTSKVEINTNTTKKSSALFSMLPKPKNSVTVGNNKNRAFTKETNRPLVPHTLTKKIEQPLKTATSSNKNNKVTMETDDADESDEDDDVVSTGFFSFNDSANQASTDTITKPDKSVENISTKSSTENITTHKPTVTQTIIKTKESDKIKTSHSSNKNTKGNAFFANLFKSKATPATTKDIEPSVEPDIAQAVESVEVNSDSCTVPKSQYNPTSYAPVTAPLVEKPELETCYGVTAPYGVQQTTGDHTGGVTAPYGGYGGYQQQHQETDTRSGGGCGGNSSGQRFFSYSHETNAQQTVPQQQQQQDQPIDYYNQPNEDTPIDRQALQALQGRKRHREDINLIDVNAQDLQTSSEEYLKNLTVEAGYKPTQSKGSGPAGQTKKKHQITYLAFQAKEREFELRQSWADSRAGKKQTQSRYGF